MVDTLDYEKYLYSVIDLPAEIAAQLPLAVHPRLRVEGEINDYPFSGAFIPSSQGHHLILGSVRHSMRHEIVDRGHYDLARRLAYILQRKTLSPAR